MFEGRGVEGTGRELTIEGFSHLCRECIKAVLKAEGFLPAFTVCIDSAVRGLSLLIG